MVELTIDGKRILAKPETTILNAALENGIYIPHICYDQRLTPYGGCRLCVVEVEGREKLLASCATSVAQEMVVNTETPEIKKARKTVLELLLLHHPLDCPICDKAGECVLQDLAFKYGPTTNRFKGERRRDPEIIEAPLVERNPSRCILCGKCVKMCQDHQGVGAINFMGRGFDSKISPAFEETLDCEFCGQCIDICPVGALGSKPYRFRSRVWFMQEVDNTCPYCGCGCTVTLGVGEGKIIRSTGKVGVGISQGDLCGRGRFGLDFVASEHRLTTPLIRQGEELKPVGWEEALSYIGKRLGEIIKKQGPGAVGALGSPRCTLEDNYMLQKFMRQTVGTNNIDSLARFGYAKAQEAVKQSFGLDALPIAFDSPLEADVMLVVESDITSTHPVFGLKVLKAVREHGARLIVADPKVTKLSKHSTEWLRIKPGTGVALLNGMMKVMLEEGLSDAESAKIPNLEELKSSLEQYTPGRVAEITGISAEELAAAARTFAKGPKRLLLLSMGSAENTKGAGTVLASANLLMLAGSGPEALQIPADYANTLGTVEAGVRPEAGPGHSPIEDRGLDVHRMLYDGTSPIKAMYIMGENPLISFPRSGTLEEALRGLELLVVQDIMLTDTAKLAHVVLPASSWAEKEGTFLTATGIRQEAVKCVPSPGSSIPDWQILRDLSMKMGKDLGARDIQELRAEVREKVPVELDPGKASLSFNPVTYEAGEGADDEYPLLMVTGILMQHSGSLTTLSKGLGSVVSDAYLQINASDAARLDVKDEGYVKVTSRTGEVYVKARVTEEVMEGMLFVPAHFPHARVNALTHLPQNGMPSTVAVKVSPAR
jgi:predicted molibdopterin-dependent oxidoreductase YjgC